jgi:curved DNA-binding protein CbpA
MDSDRNLYQILQIDPAAEQEVVQAAYKRLALKYHPDKNQSPDANRRMQELNEAYAIIGDPAQRAAYDRQRQEELTEQRRAEDEARYRAEAERRAEMARQRREQAAAQRRAENERQEKARAAAAQRRAEYEQQIRAQMAAQRRAKRERQQREWEAQQAAGQPAAPIETLVEEPAAMPEAQVWVEAEQSPIDLPRPSESERRQLALIQAQQALRNEIFKLDYGIADAVEQVKYWSRRRFPWRIDVPAGQDTQFIIGGAIAIVALLAAGFIFALGGGIDWAATCGLVGIGAGWWTWRTCVSIVPVNYLAEAWTEAKRGRELQRQHLRDELARLEAAMQVNADGRPSE